MFESKKDKVLAQLSNEYKKLDDIALAVDMSRTKTKQVLYQLKYKKLVECDVDDNWKLSVVRPIIQEEADAVIPNSTPSASAFDPEPAAKAEKPKTDPDVQSKGITAKIDDIEQKLNLALGVVPKKQKRARLKKFSKGKLKRFNKKKNRAVILLESSHRARLVKGEFIDGRVSMIKIDENFYEASTQYVWLWEGKQPVYIICEWDIRPLCSEKMYERAVKEHTLIDSQIINLRAAMMLEQESEEGQKKKGGFMLWIGIGAAALIVAWLLFGGKK